MSDRTPKEVARQSAIIIASLIAVTTLGVLKLTNNLHLWALSIIIGVIIEAASYYVILWAVEKFINQRVKVLYKTISKIKGGTDYPSTNNMDKDVLSAVNQDVMSWAEDQIKEITILRETDSFRKDFIGNLAHELKTPLFNIQGFILTLLEGGLDDPEINRKFLSKAAKNVDRMTGLLEDLDSISRIESGTLNIDLQQVNIVELCNDIVDSLEQKAEDSDITLKVKLPESRDKDISVMCDISKIEQVITNLLVNSINYGNKHGKTVVKFFDMGDNILIEVSDNGIGIKEIDLLRIYERFYRVDKSRSRHAGGSGLGLSIVKHIVEAHGQNIHVRSSIGKGTTFSFTLQKEEI